MQHYFVTKNDNTLYFKIDDIHHILHVMRLKNHDQIIGIIEGEGKYLATLNIDNNDVSATIIEKIESTNELNNQITLVYALVKQEKFELVLQKAVEIGVSEIVPFASLRSIVKIEKNDQEKKLVRWNKIAKEASEQSKRITIPKINEVKKIDEICNIDADIKLLAYEKESFQGSKKLFELLNHDDLANKYICIVIGAEGGFDEKEVVKLNQAGFINVSLGKRILRSETAAIYALSVIAFMSERSE
jgi:16S rRNA (uracil1498-N3)-methyltransferase